MLIDLIKYVLLDTINYDMTSTRKRWRYQTRLYSCFVVGVALTLFTDCAVAQNITLDGTLESAKTLEGPKYNIRQEDGVTVGNNLFHSFEQFNLKANEEAIFKSADNIRNIFSRVTGGNSTFIDGLVRTESSSVNLFLINPSGITFDSNARLYVGGSIRGSFVATTLDSLVWVDGSKFSAINPGGSSSLLTIVGEPNGFLSSLKQPKAIEFKSPKKLSNGSFLKSPYISPQLAYEGQGLLLIGGDVKVDGRILQAKSGRVELGGLAAPGTIGLNVDGNILSLDFPENVSRGNVSLTNGSLVDVHDGGGGSISINAQNLDILQGSRLKAGIAPGKGSANARSGDIDINVVREIKINGVNLPDYLSGGVYNRLENEAKGSSGNINITASLLTVSNGAIITTSNLGEGDAGDININVSEQVNFEGVGRKPNFVSSGAYSQLLSGAQGQGGNVNIEAGSLYLKDGAIVYTSTSGKGNAGNVKIDVKDVASFEGESPEEDNFFPSGVYSRVEYGALGDAGNIEINATNLFANGGGLISTSTAGEGNAGNITINTRHVNFDGEGSFNKIIKTGQSSGAYSSVKKTGRGQGGSVTITANTLDVKNGALIYASTFGEGDAGTVDINASQVVFDGQGKLFLDSQPKQESGTYTRVETDATGVGGNIKLKVDKLSVINGAVIEVSNRETGNAGNIIIRANFAVIDRKALLTGISTSGQGGNVELNLQDILLMRRNSHISTTAGTNNKPGDGGNITINATNGFLIGVPNENSDITANAFEGTGGKIEINVGKRFWIEQRSRQELESLLDAPLDPNRIITNDITAFSLQNPTFNGQITINSLNTVDPNRGLTPLPTAFVDSSELIDQTCTLSSTKSSSQFVNTGRGGLPQNPRNPLNPDATVRRLAKPIALQSRSGQSLAPLPDNKDPEAIIEAQGWVKLRNGKIRLVAQAPSTIPQGNWQATTGCYVP